LVVREPRAALVAEDPLLLFPHLRTCNLGASVNTRIIIVAKQVLPAACKEIFVIGIRITKWQVKSDGHWSFICSDVRVMDYMLHIFYEERCRNIVFE
jgi:hypothetical protein